MTALAVRRGPDDEGFWNDEHVALGFRRLSILDLTQAGHQPMASPDGRYVLVFNGEVYNHRELRRELDQRGEPPFRSSSDTEVVLRALCTWGEAALERFNGMFALAFYDTVERCLLLARDPMGIKPLYYLDDPRGAVFGSQYDQLMAHPWCDRDAVRLDVLGLYLRFGYVPSPYGLIERTHQVPAGHVLSVESGGAPVVRPFRSFPQRPDAYLPAADVDRQLAEVLGDAVDRQLISDVPVGTFLSGGIDSPLVTAVAHQSRKDLPAFTIGSADPAMDESAEAARYAAAIGCEHVVEQIGGVDAHAMLDDVVAAYGEPFADYSAFPSLLVSKLSRQRVSVMLSGDGGDELFWGYPRMWTTLEWRRFHRLPQPVRLFAHRALRGTRRRPPLGSALFDSIGDWYAHKHGWADMLAFAPSLPPPPPEFSLYDSAGASGDDGVAQWLRRVEIEGHLEKMLIKVDRASMFHSLEVRVPLLDLDLAELAAQVDPRQCMGNGLGKLPLRRALAGYVPASTLTTAKKGFTVPLGDWLRGELRETFEEHVIEHPTFLPEIWDRDRIRTVFTQHLARTHDATQALWTLLALQLWAADRLHAP